MLVPDSLQVDEKRPVMIWIHGGAFLTGSGAGNDVPANQVKCISKQRFSDHLIYFQNAIGIQKIKGDSVEPVQQVVWSK